MNTPVSITVAGPSITRAITVEAFATYLTQKGWTPAVFRDPVSGAYYNPPPGMVAPLLPVHARMLPISLAYLADAEQRPACDVLLEIATGASPAPAVEPVEQSTPAFLYAALDKVRDEASAMRELLSFAHVPWCPVANIPLMVASCDCAAAAKLGPKAIAELEDTVRALRAELAVAKGEAPPDPPPMYMVTGHWRFMHADWKGQALRWIGEQANQLHALVAQLRAGPFTDDEERTVVCTKAVRLETLAGTLQGLVDHARRMG